MIVLFLAFYFFGLSCLFRREENKMKTEKIKELGKGRKNMGKCDKEGRGGNKAGNRKQKK
jgi:hypothetical protein